MLVRIRVGVPDRPGSLGALATALGRADTDIVAIDVLESEAGRAVDDFVVRVRNGQHLAAVCQSVERLLGAAIVGVQQPAPPPSGHLELELVRQSLHNPERALQTLVDGLPGVLGADWAAVVEAGPNRSEPRVVTSSMRYSGHDHLRLADPARLTGTDVVRLGGEEPYGTAALAPIGSTGQAFLVAREHGLQFHRSELDRLGEIGSIAAHVVSTLTAA